MAEQIGKFSTTKQDEVLRNKDLVIKDKQGHTRVRLDSDTGDLRLFDQSGKILFSVDVNGGNLRLGGFGRGDGDIQLYPKAAPNHSNSQASIHMSADNASCTLGSAAGRAGALVLRDDDGDQRFLLDGKSGSVIIKTDAGDDIFVVKANGDLSLGGGNQDGDVRLRGRTDVQRIHLSAGGGSRSSHTRVHANGETGRVTLGGDGSGGDLFLLNEDDQFTVALRSQEDDHCGMWVGGRGKRGLVVARNRNGDDTVIIDGESGDIKLANADLAESFQVSDASELEPGTVVVIDEDEHLRPANQAYDRQVAGVIAGAGHFKPGLVLGHHENDDRVSLAMVGRVFVKAEADSGPIRPGDLLTTSNVHGHARRVIDPQKAQGAVIGKALGSLTSGSGLVPILVTLQ